MQLLKKAPLAIAALIVLFSLACDGNGGDQPANTATPTPSTSQPDETPASTSSSQPGAGLVVNVVNQDLGGSGEYKFVPEEFRFSVGQTVTFEMTAETELHTFSVKDLGIEEFIQAGETVSLTHTFDEPGEFEITCTPHAAFGMTAVIYVE